MISNIYGQIFAIRYYYFVYTTWKIAAFSNSTLHCLEVRFASFLSGGFITVIGVNPPERKLAKSTSVDCHELVNFDMITSYINITNIT